MSHATHTLVISDIHLGSTLSSAQSVMDFLDKISFKRLILLGDIFDGTHIFRFKKVEWDLLDYFQKIMERGVEVVWIKGNHDVVDGKHISKLKDVKFVESYSWRDNGEVYCAIHGNQFDPLSVRNASIKKVTDKLHSLFATYIRHKKTASFFERIYPKIRRLSGKISKGAVDYAKKNNIDYIICAHTHKALNLKVETENKKSINYFNTGSWVRKPFTYISIDEKGVKLGEF